MLILLFRRFCLTTWHFANTPCNLYDFAFNLMYMDRPDRSIAKMRGKVIYT